MYQRSQRIMVRSKLMSMESKFNTGVKFVRKISLLVNQLTDQVKNMPVCLDQENVYSKSRINKTKQLRSIKVTWTD